LSADELKKRSGLLVAKLCWLLELIYFENKNVLLQLLLVFLFFFAGSFRSRLSKVRQSLLPLFPAV